jgi:hypothetical protein
MPKIELKRHEAMVLAMARRRRFRMSAQELTDAVHEDRTFLRGDGRPPPREQILARAGNRAYHDLFSVAGPKGSRTISLRCRK